MLYGKIHSHIKGSNLLHRGSDPIPTLYHSWEERSKKSLGTWSKRNYNPDQFKKNDMDISKMCVQL